LAAIALIGFGLSAVVLLSPIDPRITSSNYRFVPTPTVVGIQPIADIKEPFKGCVEVKTYTFDRLTYKKVEYHCY
jgi:hypothetical protein